MQSAVPTKAGGHESQLAAGHGAPKVPQIVSEMKILIAEDDAVASQILQLTLERMGHEVVVTRTGTEAWETFDRAPVRVVVSDWMMPGIDGLEFCHRVRARPNTPYTYFILLTAVNTGAENYDLGTEAGIDDFLTKPLDAIAIRMRLRVADRILWFTGEVHQLKQLIPICAYCHKIHTAEDTGSVSKPTSSNRPDRNSAMAFAPSALKVKWRN